MIQLHALVPARDARVKPAGLPYRDLREGAEREANDHAELILAVAEQRARDKATKGLPLSLAEKRALRLAWGPGWLALLVPGVEPKPPTKADKKRRHMAVRRGRGDVPAGQVIHIHRRKAGSERP